MLRVRLQRDVRLGSGDGSGQHLVFVADVDLRDQRADTGTERGSRDAGAVHCVTLSEAHIAHPIADRVSERVVVPVSGVQHEQQREGAVSVHSVSGQCVDIIVVSGERRHMCGSVGGVFELVRQQRRVGVYRYDLQLLHCVPALHVQ